MLTTTTDRNACDLERPCRNNYHFGQLLDVQQFRLETDYFNLMRRMHNRLVTGCGVVCGLNVRPARDQEHAVIIQPGLAIDCCGREIVVDRPTQPISLEPALAMHAGKGHGAGGEPGDERREAGREREGESRKSCHVHLVLCYHECPSEPVRVHGGNGCAPEPCQPSVICERFRWEVRPGRAPEPRRCLAIPDVVRDARIDWKRLAQIVSESCPRCPGPDECCIPLANIRVAEGEKGHGCRAEEIDISVRPIVFTNELLLQLLLALMSEEPLWKRAT